MRWTCLLAITLVTTPAAADTFWVATDGDDADDGSESAPWATLGHALRSGVPAAGGHEVVVRDGTYEGTTTVTRGFDAPVVVRAEFRPNGQGCNGHSSNIKI